MLRLEWNKAKNRTNFVKHGVRFETAALVFDDPFQLSIQDRQTDIEERWQTLGLVAGLVVILVAHTWIVLDEQEVIRIISARKATKWERSNYEHHRQATS